MKTSKKYFIVLLCLFVMSILSYSSVSFAEGAEPPPHLKMLNPTINGIPFSFACNQTANLPVNSLIEFDFYVYAFSSTYVGYSFTPAAPPGLYSFTPSLPLHLLEGQESFIHFSWITPTPYAGSLLFTAIDYLGQNPSCVLFFDWAMPVELSSFASLVYGNNVTLNWSTSSEINNSGFDLERSMINGEWSKVYFVNGKGTTSSPSNYEFTDRNLSTGKYNYRLKQIDFNGNFEYFNLANEVNIGAPDKFSLSQNYPNPFNPATKISYDLPFDGKVSLTIFDITGKEVMNLIKENKSSGYYEAVVNASNLSSGVYFYRLILEGNGNNFTATKRMMVMK
ncbi:MAG: hypothetical protein HGGPFJEG_02849 [Ignavibacteria bacterium]|nr:hypothetical protein [Ignavibacteria bacterium]